MAASQPPLEWHKGVHIHEWARDVSFITNAFWITQPSPTTSGTMPTATSDATPTKSVSVSTTQTEPAQPTSKPIAKVANEKKGKKKKKEKKIDQHLGVDETHLAKQGGGVPPKEAQSVPSEETEVPFVFRAGSDPVDSAAYFLGVRMPTASKPVVLKKQADEKPRVESLENGQLTALDTAKTPSQGKPPSAEKASVAKDLGKEPRETEEAATEAKKKAKKKKKKKKKAGGQNEAEGHVDGSPKTTEASGETSETNASDAIKHDPPSKEPASLRKASGSPKSAEPPDLGTEQADGSSDGGEAPGSLSGSDNGKGRADAEDDWDNKSDWSAEGDHEGPGSSEEKAGWGEELEEDDVEQLLLLGQIQHAAQAGKSRKVAPAIKKPAPSSTRPKSANGAPNKAASAKQPGRPRGSPSEYITLPLPDGPVIVNRGDFDTQPPAAKFFVIKSNSVDDVHKSIKYGLWASTSYGNNRLHAGFQEAQEEQPRARVFLFFSVNASGRFCGVAEMTTDVDFSRSSDLWREDNQWNGQFRVQWHIIKDVPHRQFWHIKIASNEDKPVTNSRDTQDVPYSQGVEMLGIFQSSPSESSILDYFALYDTRQALLQEERERAKLRTPPDAPYLSDYRPEIPLPNFRPSGPPMMRPPFRPPFHRPVMMPFNAKTKLCQRFTATGECSYGDRCCFAHGMEELRPYPRGPPPSGPPFFPGDQRPFFPLHPHDLAAPFFPHMPGPADHRNGMPFLHQRPPGPWMLPPDDGGQSDGHPCEHHFPPFETSPPQREPPLPGAAEQSDGPPESSMDEKEAQDEYLLRLLISGGEPEPPEGQSTAGNGSAAGLAHEGAEGLEHDDEEVCCICFERGMNTVLVPCAHSLCRQCAELMQSARSSCPVCNAEIEAILPKVE